MLNVHCFILLCSMRVLRSVCDLCDLAEAKQAWNLESDDNNVALTDILQEVPLLLEVITSKSLPAGCQSGTSPTGS